MNILELFSGTESFSKVARERGHFCVTLDIEKRFNPIICKSILDISGRELLNRYIYFDVIWASPPCQSFSVASIGKNWTEGKPASESAIQSINLVEKTLRLIKEINPKHFFIENPRAMLRKQEVMEGIPRKTVTYCQYGDKRMKPTDIWTDCESWRPRLMCKNGDPCHERAPRGSRTGTQGLKNSAERGKVPHELCLEIIQVCERELKQEAK